MKWLEFVIWVYRETSLRAFCLFLMVLRIISWALVPGPEGAGLEQQSHWRVSWSGSKGEGGRGEVPVPRAITAGQLCLFSEPAHYIVMLKRSQQHWSPEQCPEFLLQPLPLTVPSAQGEKQWQDPKQHWDGSWCIPGNSLGQAWGQSTLVWWVRVVGWLVSYRAVTAGKG